MHRGCCTGLVWFISCDRVFPTFIHSGEGEEAEQVAKFHPYYEELDQGLLEHLNSRVEKSPTRTMTSGVVACIALCQGQRVLIANLGDCRRWQARQDKSPDQRPRSNGDRRDDAPCTAWPEGRGWLPLRGLVSFPRLRGLRPDHRGEMQWADFAMRM